MSDYRAKTEAAMALVLSDIIPDAKILVRLLDQFMRENNLSLQRGFHSQDPARVDEAHLLFESLASALTWPALDLDSFGMTNCQLRKRFDVIEGHANLMLGADNVRISDPVAAFAHLAAYFCNSAQSVMDEGNWTDDRRLRTTAAAQVISKLGGGSPELREAMRKFGDTVAAHHAKSEKRPNAVPARPHSY